MVAAPRLLRQEITGNVRYRNGTGMFNSNQLILQVEIKNFTVDGNTLVGESKPWFTWRDANLFDMQQIELKGELNDSKK